MQHIVSLSGGMSSAIVAERVIGRYGKSNTHLVFMDTLTEDEDNYRFIDDCLKRWGMPLIKLVEGRTPYKVAEDQSIIPNQKIAPCTFKLKIAPFNNWLQRFRTPLKQHPPACIYIGYDIFEAHRCAATTRNYNRAGWLVDYPLLWKPYLHKPYNNIIKSWGIEPPRTYVMGFTHANCLQAGCVKMGQGDWLRLLNHYPERYKITEQWEQEQRQKPGRENYAICRDQSNGTVTPLTLKDLRQRYEQSHILQSSFLYQLDTCVSCGVGDFMEA